MMRKALLLAVLSAAFLGVGAGSASATTFDGDCTFSGTVTFDVPYTLLLSNKNYEARGKGTCEGTLDGVSYDGPAHMYLDGRMNKPMSCEFGAATNVPGVITFGDNPDLVDAKRVEVSVHEFHVTAVLPFYAAGAYNGHMAGALVFDDPELKGFRKCFPDQDGLRELGFDLEGKTVTPVYG